MTAPDEFDVNQVNDQLLRLYSCQFKWWWKAACNESKEKYISCSCPQKINATKSDSAKSEIWSCLLVMTYGVKYETLVFVKCCDVSMKLTSDFCRLKKLFCGLSSFDIRPLSSNQFILESHARLKKNPSRIQKLLDYLGSLKLEVFLFFFFNHSEHMVKSHCCFINMNKNH